MILDFTRNNSGGHFDYYCKWYTSIDNKVIFSKKSFFINFFKILKSNELIIPSANILDRNFLFYYFVLIIRYLLRKHDNFIIVHTSTKIKMSIYSYIMPKKAFKYFTFSKGLNDMLNKEGFESKKIIFPNVFEFDVKSKKLKLPFDKYIVIWGRSARELDKHSIKLLSKSNFNFIILNSDINEKNFKNISTIKVLDIKEQRFVIENSHASLIILSKKSNDYFETYNGASGILITNLYLSIFTFVLGQIPSHIDEFNYGCKFLKSNNDLINIDKLISSKEIKKDFKFEYDSFENSLNS